MKSIFTLLSFAFLFSANSLFAQSWVSQSSGINQRLKAVQFINEFTGWAASENGTLLKTTNSGNNWVQYPVGSFIEDIYFIDAQKGFAASWGIVLRTTNGGLNWAQHNLGTNSGFTSIHFSGPLHGWICGDGRVFNTTDGGNTWGAQSVPTSRWLNSVYFANQSTGWVVGVIGTILATTNGGSTWTLQQNVSWDVQDVFFINSSTGWLCTTTGKILKTTNGGNNWLQQVESVAGHLYSVRFINENTGWACGTGSNIAATTNGGAVWFSQSLGGSIDYEDVFPVNAQTGYIVGNNGLLLKTTNGGGAPIYPAAPTNLTGTAVSSTQINLSWQDNSVNEQYFSIERSPDGSTGWSRIATPSPNSTSFQYTGLNPNETHYFRIFASGWYGNSQPSNIIQVRTLLTTPVPYTPAFNAVNVSLTPEFTWSSVSGAVVYHLQVSPDQNFTSVLYQDSAILGVTSRTLPAGILQSGVQYFWRVRAKNFGVASLYSAVMRFTTEGPAAPITPNLVSPVNNSIGSSLTPLMDWDSTLNASSFRVQVSSDSLFASTNFDTTLSHTQVTVPGGRLTNNVKYFWRVMASGPGGGSQWSAVWNFKPLLTGISGNTEIPVEFKLHNNYPNPFNPSTTIKYDLPENSFVKIRVFDITGREIHTLVNEQKQAGRYEVSFNASSLSSGVYFYRIEAGKFTEMKRMVLVK